MTAFVTLLGMVNYLAVLVCALIAMVLGALWYSTKLFGTAWMKGIGLKIEDIDKSASAKGMIVSAITTFIEILVLALLLILTRTSTLLRGVLLGALLSLGIIATVTLSNTMFEQGKLRIWFINAGYRIIYFLISGGILAVWR